MNLKFILFPFGVITASVAIAQDQSVISAAGDCNKNGNISLEWTVGETMVETINSGKGMLTQGFHQPLLIKKLPQVIPALPVLPDYLFTIAPNPVISELTVTVDKRITTKVQVQLTDLFGRTLSLMAPSYNRYFKFSFQNHPSGTYYIFIRNEDGALLKSFSVIK